MDPPFGGRVEPLVHTLRELSATYKRLCENPDEESLPVLWAFPYFAEPYIKNMMPEMKIHDYQVNLVLINSYLYSERGVESSK